MRNIEVEFVTSSDLGMSIFNWILLILDETNSWCVYFVS